VALSSSECSSEEHGGRVLAWRCQFFLERNGLVEMLPRLWTISRILDANGMHVTTSGLCCTVQYEIRETGQGFLRRLTMGVT